MHNEFTAVIEHDGKWYIAYCPEVPGANGQGRTKEEAKENLSEAIALILEDRRADGRLSETQQPPGTFAPTRVLPETRGSRAFSLDQSANWRG